jgi:hypothetical protein
MAGFLRGWVTQANLPLGIRNTTTSQNLAQDWQARLVQALLYSPGTPWTWWGDSDGAAVQVGSGSLLNKDCLTINGMIVPLLNGAGITAAEVVVAINSMNLAGITASIDTGQVKVDSSGDDFVFGGLPATLVTFGVNTTPTASATTAATWPITLATFVPSKWKQADSDGNNYSWVFLKAAGVVGGVDAYLLIAYRPGPNNFFDDPYGGGSGNSGFTDMRLFYGAGTPANTTSGSWHEPDGDTLTELFLNPPWAPDGNLSGELVAVTDTFADADVKTDTDGSITGSGTTHRYIILSKQPISQTDVGNGVEILKQNALQYPSAANVYPVAESPAYKGRYIYLPAYSSALAPITANYFVWKSDSAIVNGAGTPLQIVPRGRSAAATEYARQAYLFVSVNESGSFTAWVSRTGDGFGPTECMSPVVNFATPTLKGLVLGVVNWRKSQGALSFSKTVEYPGMTQVASFLRIVSRVSRLGVFAVDEFPNPFGLDPDLLSPGQLLVVDAGGSAVPAMATSQRGLQTRSVEALSANGLNSVAALLKLEAGAVAGLLGIDTADLMVDAGQSLEPNLDPLSGDAIFFDIPIWRIGVPALLGADEPIGTEYRGVLDGIQWAPSTLTEGSVTPAICADADGQLIFLGPDWDLSGATIAIEGSDGVSHAPDITAVTSPEELLEVLAAERIPGVGFRLLYDGLGLALTSTSQIDITAGGTLAAQTHVDTGLYFGGCEQVKVRDCVVPYVTRQTPRL